jgi:hypothetical protein
MAKPHKTSTVTPFKEPVIQPLIRVEGEKHPLEEMWDGGEPPELKSIGYGKLGKGNGWVSYVITTKGREITKIEISEPDVRGIAEESSKINFVNCFVDQLL